ncbi:alpha/beta fold hydrolase [Nocardia sp. CS682]|uniref:alpha/beta fold hydrolase n=1 Tax=Nocardia sp. CS682 TaxID=1047172 RepID=UPI00197E8DF9|nr:alpha/beta hydrolase [Nocardia sp. CS682]
MTLSHDVAGVGPTLVLLHSGVCDRRMWSPQWTPLIDVGYQLVRCDFRGFGQTPTTDQPYSDAEDVLALLDHLGIERAALIASSYGGEIALEIAAHHPNRTTALALLCTGVPEHNPTQDLRRFIEREEALLEAGDIAGAVELNVATWLGPRADTETRELVRRMQRLAFDTQLATLDDAHQIKRPIDLSAITAPALTISGADDLPDFRRIAARLPRILPNAHHLELADSGHLPNLEHPEETTAILIRFLQNSIPTP